MIASSITLDPRLLLLFLKQGLISCRAAGMHATWWPTALVTTLPVQHACAARHIRQPVKCRLPCMWLQVHRVVAHLTAWPGPGSVMFSMCKILTGTMSWLRHAGSRRLQHCQTSNVVKTWCTAHSAHVLQVRRLVAACLVKMYALGDSLPLYSRVSALQQFLTSKEAGPRGSPESVRLGALECLAALCGAHGRLLGASMPDSMAAAVRHAGRWELGGSWLAAVGSST